MRAAIALCATIAALVAVTPAQAGVVTISGGALIYTGAGDRDEIQFRRTGNDISITSPGTTPLTENSAACDPPSSGVVQCPGVAGAPTSVTRIRALGLDGIDAFAFSDLGASIVADADLGAGDDSAYVVDQAQPFIVIARGGPGRDTLLGGNLNDTLDGGPGNDFLRGQGGADDLIGGPDFDEVHYDDEVGRTGRVIVSLDDVGNDGNDATNERDNVRSDVEDLFGTSGDDVLNGDDDSNVIYGFEGNDTITGAGGFDVLFGDGDFSSMSGNDTIYARDGLGERVNCGAGVDKVVMDDIDGVSECETLDSSPDAVLDRDADGVTKPGDCNDTNPAIKPGVFDTPDDGIDQDCDGADATDLDRDNDGFNRPQDCDDNRATVFPGADEIAGNGRDEDCNGKDATPPVVGAGLSFNTAARGSRTRFARLVVTGLAKGDTLRITCAPSRCGLRARTLKATRSGRLDITRRIGRTLPAGARLDIAVSRSGSTTVVLRLTMRRGRTPTGSKLCRPKGSSAPRRCT